MLDFRFRCVFAAVGVAICLSGCGTGDAPRAAVQAPPMRSVAAVQAPPPTATVDMASTSTSVPEDTSPLGQADEAFRSQLWDDALADYSDLLASGLPSGAATIYGTKKYVLHQIALCYVANGIMHAQNGLYGNSEDDAKQALTFDPSNAMAKQLLKAVKTQAAKQGETAYTDYQQKQQQISNEQAMATVMYFSANMDRMMHDASKPNSWQFPGGETSVAYQLAMDRWEREDEKFNRK